MENLTPMELLIVSKTIGLILSIVVILATIFLTRLAVLHIFSKEFSIIHKKVFEDGSIAVAVYSGLIIGLISLGIIYAITQFLV